MVYKSYVEWHRYILLYITCISKENFAYKYHLFPRKYTYLALYLILHECYLYLYLWGIPQSSVSTWRCWLIHQTVFRSFWRFWNHHVSEDKHKLLHNLFSVAVITNLSDTKGVLLNSTANHSIFRPVSFKW